jgi:DNA-binding CsgD family transcriptional regulator
MRLVGRRTEQAALTGWLTEAVSSSPRVVVCTGEPGIGKTRLAEELAESAKQQGVAVAWGFGDDTAGAPPYWMWQQVLRALGTDAGIAGLSSAPTDDAARFRLFEAIAQQFRTLVADQPVLVVLDDIHWADEASLLLLRHVVRGLRAERLLLLINCREFSGRPGAVLRDLCRAPSARTLALGGLSTAGVREALGELTDVLFDDDAAESARQATGGNPLFLLELSRAAGARRIDSTRLPLTPSIRDAIAARTGSRSQRCRTFLRAASVMGLYFFPDLVGEVARMAKAELAVALDEAATASLVEAHGDQFRFVHSLIREAVLADVEPRERAALHRRAAAALLRHGSASTRSDVFSLAQHLLEAADGESLDAAEWCERAADAAMRQLAYEDAARWYRTTLRVGGSRLPSVRRCRQLLGIGAATNRSGDLSGRLAACVEAADLARREGLPTVIAEAALIMEPIGARGFNLTTRRLCEEALAALPDSEIVLRARLTARFAATYIYQAEPVVALAASSEALTRAEHSADPVAIAEACRARLAIASRPDDLVEREQLASRLEQIGTATGEPQIALAAHLAQIDTAFERGALAEVAARLKSAATTSDRVGGPVAHFSVLHSRAALAQARGRFVEARNAIREAFELMAAGDIEARFHTRAAVLSMIGRHIGPDSESLTAAGYLDAPAAIREEPGVIVVVSYAATLVSAGQMEAAREVYESAGPVSRWRIAPHVTLLAPALGIASATALGQKSDVEQFAAALEPYTGHHVVSGVGAIAYGGPVELWLGMAARHLGDLDRGIDRLSEAEQQCASIGARGYQVEAATELAEALASRGCAGDGDRAYNLAARTLAQARDLGMSPFAARLEQLTARLAPTPSTGPLTPRQVEVAELVADGLTNREIAERLTLSERTAENHVQHIMIKLGLANRSGIAVWVTQQKLSTTAE